MLARIPVCVHTGCLSPEMSDTSKYPTVHIHHCFLLFSPSVMHCILDFVYMLHMCCMLQSMHFACSVYGSLQFARTVSSYTSQAPALAAFMKKFQWDASCIISDTQELFLGSAMSWAQQLLARVCFHMACLKKCSCFACMIHSYAYVRTSRPICSHSSRQTSRVQA